MSLNCLFKGFFLGPSHQSSRLTDRAKQTIDKVGERGNVWICGSQMVGLILMTLLCKVVQEKGMVLGMLIGNNNLEMRDYPFNFNFIRWSGLSYIENPWSFPQIRGSKQKLFVDNPWDVLYESLYANLEHALTCFMASISLKEHGHP